MRTDAEFRDLPKAQIVTLANHTIRHYGGPDVASVRFKFTCTHCGSRQTFEEPNTVFDVGECEECGKETRITSYGFMLVISDLAAVHESKEHKDDETGNLQAGDEVR